jgi:hypothetical protein
MATLLDVPAVDPLEMTAPSTLLGVQFQRRSPGVAGGFVDVVVGGPARLTLSIELPRLLAERYSAEYDVHRVEGRRTQEATPSGLGDTSGWRRVCLVVIPQRTDPVITQRALTLAGLDGVHRADEILERANRPISPPVIHTGEVDPQSLADWETDGGRVFTSLTASPPV